MSSRTSPQDNISPADTPPRPSRASPPPPIAKKKKNLFLSTLHVVMEKKNALKMPPSPATIAALGTPHPSPQEPRPCQQGMWKCKVLLTWQGQGGYGETTWRGTRTCTQQSNRSRGGGVVGDDNDAVGGMATTGWGRGEDTTTEQIQQSNRSQKRGGKTVVTAVTMTMTTTTMKPRSNCGCGGGEWRVASSGNGNGNENGNGNGSGSGDDRMLR
jgi:hypothetical protein